MKLETTTADFSDEQKRYLEGFMSGLQVSRVGRGIGLAGAAGPVGKADPEPIGPDAAAFKAQDKVIASGKKLADQEKFKRDEHPFVDEQGKESLNFQISMMIYLFISFPLMLVIIGFFLAAIVLILDFVLTIVAAVKANNGEHYRYPLAIRFIK